MKSDIPIKTGGSLVVELFNTYPTAIDIHLVGLGSAKLAVNDRNKHDNSPRTSNNAPLRQLEGVEYTKEQK